MRCADAGVMSGRRSSGTDCRREVVFATIHEHNEEEVTSHLENFTSTSKTEEVNDENVRGIKEVTGSESEMTENIRVNDLMLDKNYKVTSL